jgi:hypothetical protein
MQRLCFWSSIAGVLRGGPGHKKIRQRFSFAALVICVLSAALPRLDASSTAQADSGYAPQPFVNAVETRIAQMEQIKLTRIAQESFSTIEYDVGYLISGGWTQDEFTTGAYVNPATGQPWELQTLLKQASGQDGWLPDTASTLDQEKQVVNVINSLSWRLAASPFGYRSWTLRETASHKVDNGCPQSSDQSPTTPTPKLLHEFQTLYDEGATPTIVTNSEDQTDFNLMMTDTGYGNEGGLAVVEKTRGFEIASFPQAGQDAVQLLPLPSVAVDESRMIVETNSGVEGGQPHGAGTVTVSGLGPVSKA